MSGKKKHIGCMVPGCKKEHFGKGYCTKHYTQMRAHGKIMPDKVMHTACKVPGCTGKHLAKGYCIKHYTQIKKYGEIRPDSVKYVGCKVLGCPRKHCSHGYCRKHYRQMSTHGEIKDSAHPIGCKVPGCKNEHFGKSYCQKHYAQMRKYGKIMPDKVIHTGCKVPGCTGKHFSKGYCLKHYAQISNHGSLRLDHERKPNEVIIKGKTAEILVKDRSRKIQVRVIIDAEDVEKVKGHYWFISFDTVNKIRTAIKKKSISLHRFIMGCPEKKLILHKNGSLFDCRKSNLITGTFQQAMINAKLSSKNVSGYKGVAWDKNAARWIAYLGYNGIRYHAGYFKEKEEAIAARKELEAAYHNHLKFAVEEDNK